MLVAYWIVRSLPSAGLTLCAAASSIHGMPCQSSGSLGPCQPCHTTPRILLAMQEVSFAEATVPNPTARLRVGSESHRSSRAGSRQAPGGETARAEFNFSCIFALHLPLQHQHLLVSWAGACRSVAAVSRAAFECFVQIP